MVGMMARLWVTGKGLSKVVMLVGMLVTEQLAGELAAWKDFYLVLWMVAVKDSRTAAVVAAESVGSLAGWKGE